MSTVSEGAPLCPEPGINRSPDSFDAIPASVQARADIAHNAKRLYGLLRSVQNMNAEPSYADLAAALGCGVRSIVRWMAQLVRVGLIALQRRGQGLTNIATVIGMAIRSATESRQRVPVRRQGTRMDARQKNVSKKLTGNSTYKQPGSREAMFSGPYAKYIHRGA